MSRGKVMLRYIFYFKDKHGTDDVTIEGLNESDIDDKITKWLWSRGLTRDNYQYKAYVCGMLECGEVEEKSFLCPYCQKDDDIPCDKEGFKFHIEMGLCEKYDETEMWKPEDYQKEYPKYPTYVNKYKTQQIMKIIDKSENAKSKELNEIKKILMLLFLI